MKLILNWQTEFSRSWTFQQLLICSSSGIQSRFSHHKLLELQSRYKSNLQVHRQKQLFLSINCQLSKWYKNIHGYSGFFQSRSSHALSVASLPFLVCHLQSFTSLREVCRFTGKVKVSGGGFMSDKSLPQKPPSQALLWRGNLSREDSQQPPRALRRTAYQILPEKTTKNPDYLFSQDKTV